MVQEKIFNYMSFVCAFWSHMKSWGRTAGTVSLTTRYKKARWRSWRLSWKFLEYAETHPGFVIFSDEARIARRWIHLVCRWYVQLAAIRNGIRRYKAERSTYQRVCCLKKKIWSRTISKGLTLQRKKCVWCLCMYVSFHLFIWADFVDLTWV